MRRLTTNDKRRGFVVVIEGTAWVWSPGDGIRLLHDDVSNRPAIPSGHRLHRLVHMGNAR